MKIIKTYTPAELANLFTQLHQSKQSSEVSSESLQLPAPEEDALYNAPADTYVKYIRGGIIHD